MSKIDNSAGMATPFPQAPDSSIGEARLHYLDPSGKECRVAVVPPRFTMGRANKNDLTSDKTIISREHAAIEVQKGEYWLQDLESRHGTYLNGTRVMRAKLRHGDRIQLGGPRGQVLTFYKGDLLHSLLGISEPPSEIGFSIRDFRELSGLLGAFHALSSIPVLDDLLALILDTAIDLTRGERGFIMLQNGEENLTMRCARDNNRRNILDESLRVSRLIPEKVHRNGSSKVITNLDIAKDEEAHSSTKKLGLKSIFCVPLKCLTFRDHDSSSSNRHVETIGVLYLDSQNVGADLSKNQLKTLEALALEAAMAIYNARLYEASRQKRKLEEEIAIARDLQQSMLPPPSKIVPFANAVSLSLPCHQVGGDFFDYFDLEGEKLGFSIGDVAGKGIPAALMSSKIQGILSALTSLDMPLGEMIPQVNRSLLERPIENRYSTLFFGIVDPEGNCTYINAGHNPPILVGRDGSLSELATGGTILGLFEEASYRCGTVRLRPGEHLVLFTDGVLEALNNEGEDFGEVRLHGLLKEKCRCSACEILQCMQQAVLAFSVDTPQHDDITIMVLGFREP